MSAKSIREFGRIVINPQIFGQFLKPRFRRALSCSRSQTFARAQQRSSHIWFVLRYRHFTRSVLCTGSMSRPIDYSKWDHIDVSEAEEKAPQPQETAQPQQLEQEQPTAPKEQGQPDALQPQETGRPQQLQGEPPMADDKHEQPDALVGPH